jgi:hypothetical protein
MQPPIEGNGESSEFADLLSGLGSDRQAPDLPRILALKQMEVETLRQHLQDLHAMGTNLAELEKRHIAEKEVLELEVATLQLALEVTNTSAESRRTLARARRKCLVARLRENRDLLAKSGARLKLLDQRYQRRRAEIAKLQKNVQSLRQDAKEQNTELRDLRRRLRAAEGGSVKRAKR